MRAASGRGGGPGAPHREMVEMQKHIAAGQVRAPRVDGRSSFLVLTATCVAENPVSPSPPLHFQSDAAQREVAMMKKAEEESAKANAAVRDSGKGGGRLLGPLPRRA